jgi:PAS domain S-box-containing protein/putative nucleotidyltransferase with HDIG domain
LVQVAAVLALLSLFILLFVWRTQKTYRGFGYWVLQHLTMIAALPLLAMRGSTMPFLVPVLVGNGLVLLSMLLALNGVRQFLGRGRIGYGYWAALALVEAGLGWFLYINPNMGVRVLLVSLFLGVLSLIVAWHLFFRAPTEVRASCRLLGFVMIGYGLVMLVRGFVTFVWFPGMEFLDTNATQSATYLSSILVYLLAAFGYIVVNSQRLGHEIEVTAERVRERERYLQRERALLRNVIDTSPDHICVKDSEGRFLLANEPIAQFWGLTPEAMSANGDLSGGTWPAESLRHLTRKDKEVISDLSATRFEEEVVTPTGRACWFATVKVPLLEEDGSCRKVLSFARDITERREAEGKLEASLENLRKAVGGTIQTIIQVVETRDPYTAGHQRRVADLARSMALEMGLSAEMIEGIRMAGVIHDIGKISIPAEILSKPGRLTRKEFDLVKDHPQTGFDILKDVEFPWPIAEIIYQHHERFDGSGYPRGLPGSETLLEARIMAVADVMEAIASHRPYRPAQPVEAALAEIEARKGVLYDPDVVGVCRHLFERKGYAFR